MKKVPAMSTSDSRAVLGWPRGLSCPEGWMELPFPGSNMAPAPVHVVLSPLSTSELLETEQPWRGCSWKIWGEDEGSISKISGLSYMLHKTSGAG